MRIYSVEARPSLPGGDPDLDLVKEGFSWPALLLGPLWILWHRLWLVLVGWLAAEATLAAAIMIFDLADGRETVLAVALAVLFAMHANDLRRWTLRRRGYRFAGVVVAPNLRAAERRVFEEWPPSSLHAIAP